MSPHPIEIELAAFGAFFAVDVHAADAAVAEPWRPLRELVSDPVPLRARVRAVREVLARNGGRGVDAVEQRVAASTTHLGLVARLLGPVVATAALNPRRRLDPSLERLWWQDALGAPFPLSVDATTIDGPPQVAGTAIEALTDAVAREFAVSPRVLWGNVGSAANSAARLVCEARPDLGVRAHGCADALLADPRIDGGRLRSGPIFRRRSCCLIYRLTGETSAVCGDCVLVAGS